MTSTLEVVGTAVQIAFNCVSGLVIAAGAFWFWRRGRWSPLLNISHEGEVIAIEGSHAVIRSSLLIENVGDCTADINQVVFFGKFVSLSEIFENIYAVDMSDAVGVEIGGKPYEAVPGAKSHSTKFIKAPVDFEAFVVCFWVNTTKKDFDLSNNSAMSERLEARDPAMFYDTYVILNPRTR